MKISKLLATLVLPMVFLVGCGGGSSTTAVVTPETPVTPVVPPVTPPVPPVPPTPFCAVGSAFLAMIVQVRNARGG